MADPDPTSPYVRQLLLGGFFARALPFAIYGVSVTLWLGAELNERGRGGVY